MHAPTHQDQFQEKQLQCALHTPVTIRRSRRAAQIGSCVMLCVPRTQCGLFRGTWSMWWVEHFSVSHQSQYRALESCALVPDLICQKWPEIETLGFFWNVFCEHEALAATVSSAFFLQWSYSFPNQGLHARKHRPSLGDILPFTRTRSNVFTTFCINFATSNATRVTELPNSNVAHWHLPMTRKLAK